MTKTEEAWLPQHPNVVTNLLKIWVSESFQDRHRKVVSNCALKYGLHYLDGFISRPWVPKNPTKSLIRIRK